HGFSVVEITSTNPTVATITKGGVTTNYASLQDAVDEVTDGGTITILKSGAATVSRTVSFTVTKGEGAEQNAVATITGGTRTTVTGPDANGKYTCVRSSGGSGTSGSSSYTVSVESARHGAVTASPNRAEKGDTVTITVAPDKGYKLDKLVATDSKGNELKLTKKSDTKYTFTMPASKVEVKAAFVETRQEPVPGAGFTDVPADAYYADAVAWAVKNGITTGTSASTFSPNLSCTRAQMVTFLWRAAGSPKATGSNPFTDVQSGAYYYDAVLWAVKQGITVGTSATTFSPDATVTRGQTVTFLYRAAGSPAASGASFTDVASDAYYANAVAWAVSKGITNGTGDSMFSPNLDCTRAQIVTFMFRNAK
ncbi:MAG: S-layer homology domain-containing protein, partial [Eubacteriales bacterium]|nr:S-layer homology domain-containing protein [Eubacteriales bacterium]